MGLLLILVVIAILAVAGAITGGSVDGKSQNTNVRKPNDDSVGYVSMFGSVKSADDLARERAEKLVSLERRRQGRLLYIRELNEKCIAEDGVPWMHEKDALEEFDDQHFKEYRELGVLPPSYRDGKRKRKVLYSK